MSAVPAKVLLRFRETFEEAAELPLREPTAVTLATVGADGQPTARIVLLRGVDERGFVFFTNTLSRKGQQLAENPRAALCFHWDALQEQIRVEGIVAAVSDAEADAYWQRRKRGSQIGAWASKQSETLDDRATLEQAVADLERQFADQPVPRPEHWTGYRVQPHRIEFWKSRSSRLHERDLWELSEGNWTKRLLYP